MNDDTERDIDVGSARSRWLQPTGARVLLAEDDREMRDMVATSLREDGYEVVVANDGGELLARLATASASQSPADRYDLIVSDIRMPVCSGLTMLEEVRRAHWTMPIILMTAFGDEDTRARVEKNGGVLFDKPFDLDDLRTAALHLIRTYLAQPSFTPPSGSEPLAMLVATCESSIEGWSMKWSLQAEGVHAYLGGRAMSTSIDLIYVYVLQQDAERAAEVIARLTRKRLN